MNVPGSPEKGKPYTTLEEVSIDLGNHNDAAAGTPGIPTLRKFPVAEDFVPADTGKIIDTPNFVKDLHSALLLQSQKGQDPVHIQPLLEEATCPKEAFYIKTADNQDKEILFQTANDFTVLELKKFAFPKAFDDNKNIRLIYQGRQLGDAETVANLKIKAGGFMHAFISEKVERKKTNTVPTQMNTDMRAAERIRGFERMRELGISTSDIVLQRFAFHSKRVLCDTSDNIDVSNFVNKEDEWLAINYERIFNNIQAFRDLDFNQDSQKTDGGSCQLLNQLFGFFLGFFGLLFGFLLFYFLRKRTSKSINTGIVFGCFVKLVYIAIFYYAKEEFVWTF